MVELDGNGVAEAPPSYAQVTDIEQLLDHTPVKPVDTYKVEVVPGAARPEAIDADILDMVQELSLKERIGQMTQIEIGKLMDKDGFLDPKAVEYWVGEWGVGSFLDSPGNHGGKYHCYHPAKFADIVDGIQKVALEHGPKIPMIYGLDSVHGANYVNGAVLFPQAFGTAATFNTKHAFEAGRVAAKDTRAAGIPWIFAPCLDLNTQKAWSRNYENWGEDPYLTSVMAKASVEGLQGNYKKDRTRVAACMKHFIGYSKSNTGKDRGSQWIPDNFLLEYYVAPFQAAVDAGVASAMESFSDINGQPVPTSSFYLNWLLREHMGFNGALVTDWGEIWRLFQDHKTALNTYDSTWQSIKYTSIDMSMVPDDSDFSSSLIELVKKGDISEERINESCARVLQLKKDVGLFEQPFADRSLVPTVGSLQDQELAKDAVRESLTLVKNANSALPLNDKDRILVVGPTGNSLSYQSGGWSLRWRGSEGDDSWYGGRGTTVVEGIEHVTGTRPNYISGVDINGVWEENGKEKLAAAVQSVDKVIVCLGEDTYAEFGGNLDELSLPQGQIDLVRHIADNSSADIITLLIQGRPRLLKNVPTLSSAVINCFLPGPWAGIPIAEVLYGMTNPSGRMSFTYPRYELQSTTTYWQGIYNYTNISGGSSYYNPEWAFGYGLGYSDISYSDIFLSSDVLDLEDGSLTVKIKVTNHGPYDAKEPILLYLTQQVRPGYVPDAYRLKAFDKVDLAVNESKEVSFVITKQGLEYYGRDLQKHVDSGVKFTITINAFLDHEKTAEFSTSGQYKFARN